MKSSKHLANTVMMVRPFDFDYNEETGLDNEFQNRPFGDTSNVNSLAMKEFSKMVSLVRAAEVNILILEKSHSLGRMQAPDAVFPNNWFSTELDGTVLMYPMYAENRRAEKRIGDVENLLMESNYFIKNVIHIGRPNEDEKILEGTGSMIIDHTNRNIFAAISKRCHPEQFANFVELRNYNQGILFNTKSSKGTPIYHTNVMMSIADKFAVICLDSICDADERKRVTSTLEQTHEIIDISFEQMEKSFCGNILQVKNVRDEPVTIMSQSAYDGFTQEQMEKIRSYGKVVSANINTIESIGGGSARCMMAEVFLQKI